jgi:hypothetical protein
MAEHGTLARYKKHVRDKDVACQPCRDANAEDGRIRRDGGEGHELDKLRKRAVSRAQTRLRNTFRIEFEAFYQEEMRNDGQRSSQ